MSGLEFALGGEHCYSFPISASGHTSTKPRLEHKSADERLIAFARARPGELNFAAGSKRSASHLAAEMFKDMARLNMVFLPYKGAGPALNDAIAGSRAEMLSRRSFGKRNELPMHLARDRNADGAVSLTLLE
jgi:hypothetical protein